MVALAFKTAAGELHGTQLPDVGHQSCMLHTAATGLPSSRSMEGELEVNASSQAITQSRQGFLLDLLPRFEVGTHTTVACLVFFLTSHFADLLRMAHSINH